MAKKAANFREAKLDVLVATDVAARGIDIPGVRHVYNYDMPNVPENYVHRIGRTARAGAEGKAIAFCAPAEMDEFKAIEKMLKTPLPVIGGAPWAGDAVSAAAKSNQNRGGRQQPKGTQQRSGQKSAGPKPAAQPGQNRFAGKPASKPSNRPEGGLSAPRKSVRHSGQSRPKAAAI